MLTICDLRNTSALIIVKCSSTAYNSLDLCLQRAAQSGINSNICVSLSVDSCKVLTLKAV